MALAAPAQKDSFFYAGDTLYCEASNLSRHRRATLVELKAHFNGRGTDNDHPAHWYEAQLLHYGLAPSKVKGTAHKRLFDAVMKGGLKVPAHIQKIETDLKKEWTKRERETKKMMKESAAAPPKAKSGTKRKADAVSSTNVNVNVSFQVSSTGQVMMQATAPPAAKKAKTMSASKAAAMSKAAPKVTPKATLKAVAKAPKAASKAVPKATKTKAAPKATPPTKPVKPTAKGKATSTPKSGQYSFDDAPPPYAEFDPHRGSSNQAYGL
ncbi:hypothetical protein N0V82_009931 [Gnomoniopsis sp. IMI 355080]|nr:hypothetical protein N0V82_009931 [Gnomoniopsis sp. IMI 355080]